MEALLGEGGNYTSVSASVCPAHHALVGRVGFPAGRSQGLGEERRGHSVGIKRAQRPSGLIRPPPSFLFCFLNSFYVGEF